MELCAPLETSVKFSPESEAGLSQCRNQEVCLSLTQQSTAENRTRMSASASLSELRLVVLGRTGAGKRSAVCTILGLQDSEQGEDPAVTQECSKHRGQAAGRQVAVVSSPPWFGSECNPEGRRKHISSFIALSSPGPHVFLLCVPVNQPADGEAKALAVLNKLFGPSAVSRHTIVLFTHMEELEEDEQLDEYLTAWRQDLLELVGKCGNRYHTLETRGEEPGNSTTVEELLEKVEQVLRGSSAQHLSCPLYQEAEDRVRKRQVEIVRQRRGEEPSESSSEVVTEEEMETVREEAESSISDLDVDIDGIFPATSVSQAPSFPWSLWEKLKSWLSWLPTLVRREALLGSLVGLFVGGQYGGMLGTTVGSVATEMGRRKTEKTK